MITVNFPTARHDGLIVERLDDEVLVFDELAGRGHCLSGDAARVWDLCDGTRSHDGLARDLGLPADALASALAQLDACSLLEPTIEAMVYSRRDMSKLAAKAALATPVIYSLSVSPAAATPLACSTVSCSGNQDEANATCRSNANCQSTSNCEGPKSGGVISDGKCKF